MKKAILFIISFAAAHTTFACKAIFDFVARPVNNELLKVVVINKSKIDLTTDSTRTYSIINWGDGTTSTSSTTWQEEAAKSLVSDPNALPSHNYKQPGTYKITLKVVVTDVINDAPRLAICKDSTTKTVTVAYSHCATTFTRVKIKDLTYQFTATTPAGAQGMTYTWSFYDATPFVTGASVQHTYSKDAYIREGEVMQAVTLTATSKIYNCTYQNTTNGDGNIFRAATRIDGKR